MHKGIICEIDEDEARETRIINEFQKQFGGLKIRDICFHGRYKFYVRTWLPSTNLIVTFYPGQNTFDVQSIHADWAILEEISRYKQSL